MVQPKKTVLTDAQKERRRQRVQICREKKKEEAQGSSNLLNSPPKKKIKDMNLEELREYKRKKQQERRSKLANELKTDDSEEDSGSEKIENSEEEKEDDSDKEENEENKDENKVNEKNEESTEIPERQLNVKLRIAHVNIFDIETDAIVIPYFCEDSRKRRLREENSLHTQLLHHYASHGNELTDFRESFLGSILKGELRSNSVCHFAWKNGNNRKKLTLHLDTSSEYQTFHSYDAFDEMQLRGSYMACLLEADKLNCRSLAIPILGFKSEKKRSVAIGIQCVFAYMQAVETTNLEVVYFVVKRQKVYEEIGEFLFFVKEFDFRVWNRSLYFSFEKLIFDKLLPNYYFSSVPGTDMVLRCTTVSHDRVIPAGNSSTPFLTYKKSHKSILDDARVYHKDMGRLTNITTSEFRMFSCSNYDAYTLPKQYIRVQPVRRESTNLQIYNHIAEARELCKVYSILRTMWIFSRYYLYYQGEDYSHEDFTVGSEKYENRRQRFMESMDHHKHLLRKYTQVTSTNTKVNVCDCGDWETTHKKFSPFLTPLSHHDVLFDQLILCHRTLITSSVSQFIGYFRNLTDPPNTSYSFVYSGGKKEILQVRDEVYLKQMKELRKRCWIENRENVLKEQQKSRDELTETLELQYPLDNDDAMMQSDFFHKYLNLDRGYNEQQSLEQDLQLEIKWRRYLFDQFKDWKVDEFYEDLLSMKENPRILLLRGGQKESIVNSIINLLYCCQSTRNSIHPVWHRRIRNSYYNVQLEFSSEVSKVFSKKYRNTSGLLKFIDSKRADGNDDFLDTFRIIMKIIDKERRGLFRMQSLEFYGSCGCGKFYRNHTPQKNMPTHIEVDIGSYTDFEVALNTYIYNECYGKNCCGTRRPERFHINSNHLILTSSRREGSFVNFPIDECEIFHDTYVLRGFVEQGRNSYKTWTIYNREWFAVQDDILEKKPSVNPYLAKILIYDKKQYT